MPKLILGLTSMPGAGKGTAAKYLKDKYGATIFGFSSPLADILTRLNLEKTRPNFQKLSFILRQGFGEDVLAYAIENDAVNADSDLVVIEGIRRIEDLVALEPLPYFKLLAIHVPPEIRFERMKKRGEKAGENQMTWEQFQAQDSAETELTIPATMARAWRTIDNTGTLDDLTRQLDVIMAELGVPPKI